MMHNLWHQSLLYSCFRLWPKWKFLAKKHFQKFLPPFNFYAKWHVVEASMIAFYDDILSCIIYSLLLRCFLSVRHASPSSAHHKPSSNQTANSLRLRLLYQIINSLSFPLLCTSCIFSMDCAVLCAFRSMPTALLRQKHCLLREKARGKQNLMPERFDSNRASHSSAELCRNQNVAFALLCLHSLQLFVCHSLFLLRLHFLLSLWLNR